MKNKMRLFSIAALAMAVMTLASCQKDEMISGNGTVDLFGWVGASSTMTGVAQYGITTSESTSSTDGYGNAEDEAMKTDWGTLAISNGGNTTNQSMAHADRWQQRVCRMVLPPRNPWL